MDMTQRLLGAWREAEPAAENAPAGSIEWQLARLAADNASAAYRLHIESMLDVAGHAFDASPRPQAADQPPAQEPDERRDRPADPPDPAR